jgi:NAD(P)-dependent dehydrogenase (short-subunit alcohol dehydrogenase family)
VVACDVTNADQLEAAVDATLDRFGSIDAVVANAGVNAVGTMETIDTETWEKVVEVNLFGVVRTVRAVLPHIISSRGYILPVSSLAGAMPLALGTHYTAAKHGVNGYAQALRLELAAAGVDVGCAYFGAIDTDLLRDSSADPATAAMIDGLPKRISRSIPAAKAGEAIARGVARRSRRVIAPRWILPMLIAPGVFTPLAERGGAAATRAAVKLANDRARAGHAGAATFVADRDPDRTAT